MFDLQAQRFNSCRGRGGANYEHPRLTTPRADGERPAAGAVVDVAAVQAVYRHGASDAPAFVLSQLQAHAGRAGCALAALLGKACSTTGPGLVLAAAIASPSRRRRPGSCRR
jgi:hypothetical protein